MLTFVAGQKYGVWRDATRRFCLCEIRCKKEQGQQVNQLLPLSYLIFIKHDTSKEHTQTALYSRPWKNDNISLIIVLSAAVRRFLSVYFLKNNSRCV